MGMMSISRAVAASALLLGSTLVAQAETVLTLSNYIPAGHFFNERVMKVWMENVAKASGGSIRINMLPKVVGTLPAQYDVAVDGLADIVLFNPGYSPGRFDLAGIGEAPLMSEDPKASSIAFSRFYDKELKPLGLFKEVQMLSVFTAAPGNMITRGAPPKSFEGLKGMKIRNPLPVTKILLDNAGAVPVSKPISEAYELMSTGVVDATLLGYDTVTGFKLNEVAKGAIEVPGGLYNASVGVAMNKGKWDKLKPEEQKALMDVSGEKLAALVGDVYYVALQEGKQALIKSGAEYVVADKAFVDKVREASKPVYDNLIKVATTAGAKDPEKILDRYRALITTVQAEIKK